CSDWHDTRRRPRLYCLVYRPNLPSNVRRPRSGNPSSNPRASACLQILGSFCGCRPLWVHNPHWNRSRPGNPLIVQPWFHDEQHRRWNLRLAECRNSALHWFGRAYRSRIHLQSSNASCTHRQARLRLRYDVSRCGCNGAPRSLGL
ncbi:hypothetical protein FRC07_014331, partial [Ceratobasidium sp. 392]